MQRIPRPGGASARPFLRTLTAAVVGVSALATAPPPASAQKTDWTCLGTYLLPPTFKFKSWQIDLAITRVPRRRLRPGETWRMGARIKYSCDVCKIVSRRTLTVRATLLRGIAYNTTNGNYRIARRGAMIGTYRLGRKRCNRTTDFTIPVRTPDPRRLGRTDRRGTRHTVYLTFCHNDRCARPRAVAVLTPAFRAFPVDVKATSLSVQPTSARIQQRVRFRASATNLGRTTVRDVRFTLYRARRSFHDNRGTRYGSATVKLIRPRVTRFVNIVARMPYPFQRDCIRSGSARRCGPEIFRVCVSGRYDDRNSANDCTRLILVRHR